MRAFLSGSCNLQATGNRKKVKALWLACPKTSKPTTTTTGQQQHHQQHAKILSVGAHWNANYTAGFDIIFIIICPTSHSRPPLPFSTPSLCCLNLFSASTNKLNFSIFVAFMFYTEQESSLINFALKFQLCQISRNKSTKPPASYSTLIIKSVRGKQNLFYTLWLSMKRSLMGFVWKGSWQVKAHKRKYEHRDCQSIGKAWIQYNNNMVLWNFQYFTLTNNWRR